MGAQAESQVRVILPEPGFYYHHVHDPSKGVQHAAYKLVGHGFDEEDECIMALQPVFPRFPSVPGHIFTFVKLADFTTRIKIGRRRWIEPYVRISDELTIVELEMCHQGLYPTKQGGER